MLTLRLVFAGMFLAYLSGTMEAADNKPEAPKAKAGKKVAATPKSFASSNLLACKEFSNLIDLEINKKLAAEKSPASPKSSDAEFMRRVYLDLIGRIPSVEEAESFLASSASDKRAKLIEELLADPEFGKHLADIWQALLLPRISDNRRVQAEPLVTWLENQFNTNVSWDKITRELLTATGAQDENGAVTYFVANATVDKMTDSASRLFLGVQLQCAQCHDHPFVEWKQKDYWGMAAFFMKVQTRAPKGKDTGAPTVAETKVVNLKKNNLPEAAQNVPAKFPGDREAKLNEAAPYRPSFADWLVAKNNPYFSRAMVNRVWQQFFGQGMVDPVDDMHEGNAPTHPELLEGLAGQFAASGFDIKHLIRAICNSETYQRSSKPTEGNKDTSLPLLAHMPVRNLSPEQLFDSISTLVGKGNRPSKAEMKKQKQVKGALLRGPRAQFVAFFQPAEGVSQLSYETGIPQVLRLMNSPQMNQTQAFTRLMGKDMPPAAAMEKLFLATLSRKPTPEETEKMNAFLAKAGDSRTGLSDILWVLMNSSEFTLNH
ncbi:MAG: DUF1553 domain-containing protein [Gemmataceae bacterium]|nr:DUF1553 domain-containing protein [Gemmataceae bacterium]